MLYITKKLDDGNEGKVLKAIILTTLPAILILMFSLIGYLVKNSEKILNKTPLERTDEMVFGHYWIIFSLVNLIFLCRLTDEGKWNVSYIPKDYVSLFFSISIIFLIFLWFFSIFFLKYLATKDQKLDRRHLVNLLGVISIFTLSLGLSGV